MKISMLKKLLSCLFAFAILLSSTTVYADEKLDVNYGDFAENLTTEGIDLPSLPIGTHLKVGKKVLLEVSQIGKVCHNRCNIFYTVGDCVMPREGIFAKVIVGGEIKVNDEIAIDEITKS